MVGQLDCLWCVFLFQLSTVSFIPRQRAITGTTPLANWLAPFIVFYRRSNKELHCLLWSSGTNTCWRISQIFLLLHMESSCAWRECWQLSKRLGVLIWERSSNETPVDVSALRSSLTGTMMRLCICWVCCGMGFGNEGGSRVVRSRLVGLKTSPLSKRNDSWSGLGGGAALT